MLSGYFFILLHQRNINFCVFVDFYSKLWIVKPSVITLELDMLRNFIDLVFSLKQKILLMCICVILYMGLFTQCSKSFIILLVEINWAPTPISFTGPFSLDRVNLPVFRKYFIDDHSIKLKHKIAYIHPP